MNTVRSAPHRSPDFHVDSQSNSSTLPSTVEQLSMAINRSDSFNSRGSSSFTPSTSSSTGSTEVCPTKSTARSTSRQSLTTSTSTKSKQSNEEGVKRNNFNEFNNIQTKKQSFADVEQLEPPVPSNSTSSGRKSVKIMIKTSPTHEFQVHNNIIALSACTSTKKSEKRSINVTPPKISDKRPSLPAEKQEDIRTTKEIPRPVSDSVLAKVSSVVTNLKDRHRRPAQKIILALCQRHWNLSDTTVMSALEYLVSIGQLHKVPFSNGFSYRFHEHSVARGDLERPRKLSAKIKAKYASAVKKTQSSTALSGMQCGAKRTNPVKATYSPPSKMARRDENGTKNYHRNCSMPDCRGSVMDQTLTRKFSIPPSKSERNFVGYSAIATHLSTTRECNHVNENHSADSQQSRLLESAIGPVQQGTRVYVVPPASPMKESMLERRLNDLPHRTVQNCSESDIFFDQNGKNNSSTSRRSTSQSGVADEVPERAESSGVPSQAGPTGRPINYRFKSIIVRKNMNGRLTEVWLQSPGSTLKNAFTIQVLNELTRVLNNAVYDNTRLVVISGLGTVFSAGIDLVSLTGPLHDSSFCCKTAMENSLHDSLSQNEASVCPTGGAEADHAVIDPTPESPKCCNEATISDSSTVRMEVTANVSELADVQLNCSYTDRCVNCNCFRIPADPSVKYRMATALRSFLLSLVAFPKLVVAGVNGPAMGLAVAILPLCDLVYASDTATFHLPYIRLGQTPEAGSSFTLTSLIGLPLANDLLLAGRKLSAREALQRGLISDLLFPRSFKQELIARCLKLLDASPMALEVTKCIIRTQQRDRIEFVIKTECEKLNEIWQTPEFHRSALDFVSREMEDFL